MDVDFFDAAAPRSVVVADRAAGVADGDLPAVLTLVTEDVLLHSDADVHLVRALDAVRAVAEGTVHSVGE